MHFIIGLGNPGARYAGTRHNTGRSAVEAFARARRFRDFRPEKKLDALVSEGKIGKEKVMLVLPETFMNHSGKTVGTLVTAKKAAAKALVVHDDLDMPVGRLRISFGRSSGGHRGVESVIRSLKTKDFPRLRIGIAPATSSGKIKKPVGEKQVLDFILAVPSRREREALSKALKTAREAMEVFVADGYPAAMNRFN